MARHCLIAVGALAIDTILTVPHFPEEDGKLRAKSLSKRRGGNCPNSLEVLNQLLLVVDDTDSREKTIIPPDQDQDYRGPSQGLELMLIASLPDQISGAHEFINASFSSPSHRSRVNLDYSIFHSGHNEPVSSYIISSQASGSRTIVNHNELPEMTLKEFKARVENILETRINLSQIWFHFEGRIPSTILECIQYLRQHPSLITKPGVPLLKISVELEKPGREGLQALAHQADIVFFSKSWAEHEGYNSAATCLTEQSKILESSPTLHAFVDTGSQRTLVCTWGDQGSCALEINSSSKSQVIHSPAYMVPNAQIVDTVGAGDTFIAGMLFGFIYRSDLWSLRQKLDFANELAGRKVLQDGFGVLAEQVKSLLC